MFRYLAIPAVASLLLWSSVGYGQAKLTAGDPAPAFKGLDTTSGDKISLGDIKQDVVVVAITCNHCPIAIAYEDRVIDFCKKHCGEGSKVALVAINVNNTEADKLPAMKVRAKEKGFNFPYAYDPSQQIARALGASKTPEFYVFNKDRKLVYQGAFDDNNDPSRAKVNYVEQAVKAALTGGEAPKSTAARGCSVKFDK